MLLQRHGLAKSILGRRVDARFGAQHPAESPGAKRKTRRHRRIKNACWIVTACAAGAVALQLAFAQSPRPIAPRRVVPAPPVTPNPAPPVTINPAPPITPNPAPPITPNPAPPITPNPAPPISANPAPPTVINPAPSITPNPAPPITPNPAVMAT